MLHLSFLLFRVCDIALVSLSNTVPETCDMEALARMADVIGIVRVVDEVADKQAIVGRFRTRRFYTVEWIDQWYRSPILPPDLDLSRLELVRHDEYDNQTSTYLVFGILHHHSGVVSVGDIGWSGVIPLNENLQTILGISACSPHGSVASVRRVVDNSITHQSGLSVVLAAPHCEACRLKLSPSAPGIPYRKLTFYGVDGKSWPSDVQTALLDENSLTEARIAKLEEGRRSGMALFGKWENGAFICITIVSLDFAKILWSKTENRPQ